MSKILKFWKSTAIEINNNIFPKSKQIKCKQIDYDHRLTPVSQSEAQGPGKLTLKILQVFESQAWTKMFLKKNLSYFHHFFCRHVFNDLNLFHCFAVSD